MDHGKKPSKVLGARNNKIYMDLKDIIREHALPFLPAKSLLKFRGVCRDWKLMISTPFFAHNQSLSFRALSGLFYQNSGHPPTFISIDPQSSGIPDPSLKFLPVVPVDILASSNGLLCCQARTVDRTYYICNPVTMQWKELPKPSMDHGREPSVVLNFEPSLLNFVAEYKLICGFSSTDFDDAIEFEIYSSKDGSWKVSGEINFVCKKLVPKSGVCVNNVVYWQTNQGSILAFDLTMDRSQLIPCYYSNNATLGEMNGKLCSGFVNGRTLVLSVISNIYSNTMQMNSHAKLWDDRLRIPLTGQHLNVGSLDRSTVQHAGSDAFVFVGGGNIHCYDVKSKEIKLVGVAPRDEARAVPYVNSLVSL